MFRALVFTIIAGLLAVAAGCSPIEKQHRREAEATRSVPFSTVRQAPETHRGRFFVWGGWIAETRNIPGGTELVVVQTPLDGSDQPREASRSQGRFIIRSKQFLDPLVYARDRAVTAAGTLSGSEERALDKTTYVYPLLEARQIHLWPPEPPPSPRFHFG